MSFHPRDRVLANTILAGQQGTYRHITPRVALLLADSGLIAAAVLAQTGSSFWISVYIVGCAVVSLVALVAMRRGAPGDALATRSAEADRTSRST